MIIFIVDKYLLGYSTPGTYSYKIVIDVLYDTYLERVERERIVESAYEFHSTYSYFFQQIHLNANELRDAM